MGQTSNFEQRLQYHNSGRNKSTKRRVPFALIYVEKFQTRSEAMKTEKILKHIKSKDFKKQLRGINSAG